MELLQIATCYSAYTVPVLGMLVYSIYGQDGADWYLVAAVDSCSVILADHDE